MPELKIQNTSKGGATPQQTDVASPAKTKRPWTIHTAKLYRNKMYISIATNQLRLLRFKRKGLEKMGIRETELVNKIGIENSFAAVKSSQKAGIRMEYANIFVSGAASLIGTAALIYAESKGIPYEIYMKGLHVIKETHDSTMHLLFNAALWSGIASEAINILGNIKDAVTQLFLSSITASVDRAIRPKIKAIHKKYTVPLLREYSMDVPLVFAPIMPVLFATRFWAVKFQRKRHQIVQDMEKVYKENEAKKLGIALEKDKC